MNYLVSDDSPLFNCVSSLYSFGLIFNSCYLFLEWAVTINFRDGLLSFAFSFIIILHSSDKKFDLDSIMTGAPGVAARRLQVLPYCV